MPLQAHETRDVAEPEGIEDPGHHLLVARAPVVKIEQRVKARGRRANRGTPWGLVASQQRGPQPLSKRRCARPAESRAVLRAARRPGAPCGPRRKAAKPWMLVDDVELSMRCSGASGEQLRRSQKLVRVKRPSQVFLGSTGCDFRSPGEKTNEGVAKVELLPRAPKWPMVVPATAKLPSGAAATQPATSP